MLVLVLKWVIFVLATHILHFVLVERKRGTMPPYLREATRPEIVKNLMIHEHTKEDASLANHDEQKCPHSPSYHHRKVIKGDIHILKREKLCCACHRMDLYADLILLHVCVNLTHNCTQSKQEKSKTENK